MAKVARKVKADSDGLVMVQCDVLDPAPDGSELGDEVMVQAARDCAQFAPLVFLEPKGFVFLGEEVTVWRHRFVLMFPARKLDAVMGHLTAYAQTVLEGHDVLVNILPARGYFRTEGNMKSNAA